MLVTRNFRDWHAIIGEVTWSSVLKTTMDSHSKLVLHSLGNNQHKLRRCWGSDITDWMGMPLPHCVTMARDRKRWRSLCIDL